jgi:chemotaxis protein CheC
MHRDYTALELSAIQEIVNVGTGNAATALSQLVQREVDLGVPGIDVVEIWDAAGRIGPAELPVAAILTPLDSESSVSIALIFSEEAAQTLCRLLGTEHGTEMGQSALQEIGNILTGSYVTAMSAMTGRLLEPLPPAFACDMRGSIIGAIVAMAVGASDTVILLRAAISIRDEACDFSLLFLPEAGALDEILASLGLA